MRARLLVLAVALAASLSDSAVANTTVTKSYVGGPGWMTYVTFCDHENPTSESIGVVCFPRTAADRVALTIVDESGLPVGARAIWVDPSGNWAYGPPFCGKSGQLPVARGWRQLNIYVGGPLETAWYCTGWFQPGAAATRGVVQAEFIVDEIEQAKAPPKADEPAPPSAAPPPPAAESSPAPEEDTAAPVASCRIVPGQKLRAVLRRGLAVRWTVSETANVRFGVATRRYGLVGRWRRELRAGDQTVAVRLNRAAKRRLRGLRAVPLAVLADVTDAAGNVATARCRGAVS